VTVSLSNIRNFRSGDHEGAWSGFSVRSKVRETIVVITY